MWEPGPGAAESPLARYTRWLASDRGLRFDSYQALWEWSVRELPGFWASIRDFFEVDLEGTVVLGRREMPGAEWFPGSTTSYAAHVFRGKPDDSVAIVHASELRPAAELTWGELRALTGAIAGGLRELGVERGDRVAAYLPNTPEAVAALLACASIGAIWSSCAPEFGRASVVERFGQIEPKVLLCADGYRYGGRDFSRAALADELAGSIASLERTVLLPHLDPGTRSSRCLPWEDFLRPGALSFERLPFDHPLWILYSSGTTGPPKAIVHGQGGILLEHLKELHFHLDARAGERLFWFTTTSWMMWNLLVGGLLTEAAIVLYDGSPAARDGAALWDLAADAGITCFGTSAAFIHACMKSGTEPGQGRDLSALRAVGSTGSPLSPEGFRWVYDKLGADTWLFSTSGGTDVCTAFVGGVPTLPVYEGELQARALGAKVEAFDEHGSSVVDEVGELVLTEPLPSMPVGFWDDPDGSRYRESYFSVYPGVWRHGDWIRITSRGTAVISGRSDATINRGGVRIGTSELYRALLALDEVVDALAVDVSTGELDSRLLLFVVTSDGGRLDEPLEAEIRRQIREQCSPRHVPDEIREVPAIPRTRSGKILEVPIKRILEGAPLETAVSLDALANPEALQYFLPRQD